MLILLAVTGGIVLFKVRLVQQFNYENTSPSQVSVLDAELDLDVSTFRAKSRVNFSLLVDMKL